MFHEVKAMGEREREDARERGGVRESEGACDGDDEETGEASRKRSFTVESKTFELVLDGRKGRCQILIVEKKRGVSTWVRLGLESLGLFKEGLIHCIRDEEEGRWEKEWRERGKRFSLVRGFNRSGGFLRLGVVDLERKHFCIFLPRGRRAKRGWTTMVEIIQQMEEMVGRRMEVQVVRAGGKISPTKSYVEAVTSTNQKGATAIKMKVAREEMAENLQKLKHCLVASWKSNKKEDEDLERMGSLWARSWGLKGKLGMAKLERGRALLEFEDIKEAHRVASSGSRVMGGIFLGLDFWNPKSGCWGEKERAQEAWVKIFGLPMSLWSPAILKKIGEECGGFVDIDERTRSMGEIQWARILVKMRGEFRPSILEIEAEEEVYTLALWWEIRPEVRRLPSVEETRRRIEIRGDMHSRAEKRVGKEVTEAGIEGQLLTDDGRLLQKNGPGLKSGNQTYGPMPRDWVYVDGIKDGLPLCGLSMGLNEQEKEGGLAKLNGPLGRKLKEKSKEAGESEAGPSNWAADLGCHFSAGMDGLVMDGPLFLGRSNSRNIINPEDPLMCWVPEEIRREQGEVGFSLTDRALEEEAKRYVLHSHSKGYGVMGTFLPSSSNSDRAPVGGSIDCPGEIEEESWGDKSTWLTVYEGNGENDNRPWKLGEANKSRDKGRDKEGKVGASESQDNENEKEELWEECDLAKFSQFLGFSTKGLEREILNFLTKIRKRREKIHSKEFLEKSKFERELKRLECSVNYEGGYKQKDLSQGKGNQLIVAQ